MPTTVTSSIGTSGRTYSTLQAWEDAIAADLVAADQVHVGECYNDSEFSAAGVLLTVSGHTTDATRYIELKCGAGQSFRNHADVRTNALRYNQANGVGISCTADYTYAISITDSYVRLTDLQIQGTNGNGGGGVNLNSSTDVTARNCIISARNVWKQPGPNGSLAVNCLLRARGAGDIIGAANGSNRLEFCTLVRETAGGSPGAAAYGTLTVENCAIFNFTTGFTTGTSGVLAGGFNCTDLASAPGSNNQVSKTYANQFENTTNDWRAKTGGDLANGTPATSLATDDISGVTRHATTPYIGAWELVTLRRWILGTH